MKNKKLLRYLGIAVVVLVIFMMIAKNKGCVGGIKPVKVAVEKATKRTITETVTANGKIQPEVEVKLAPDVSGEVVELYVKEGDKIKEGDMLIKINPDIYESALDRMEAALNTSRANLANAKARLAQTKAQFINTEANFKRNEKLYKDGVISDSDFDNIKANYEVSKADVQAAEQNVIASQYNVKSAAAALKEAKESLSKTVIYAPMSGTISKLDVEKGERVVGTSQFAGTEIMRIANINEMEVNVSVNENDIVRVHHGDTALIEVDAYLDKKFKGIVTEIASSANTIGVSADQATNFDVKIRILRDSYKDLLNDKDSYQSPFRPGMSATVDIQTKTAYDVLSIPIQSVTSREDTVKQADSINQESITKDTQEDEKDLKEYVFVFKEGKAKMVAVKTGIQDNKFIEITEGLSDDNEIIIAPYRAISKKLKNNMEVEKVKKENLYDME